MDKYQRVYCSEYFSSIELIPLETREDCLLDLFSAPQVKLKDDLIFMHGNGRFYAFNRSGKFLNQIGGKGQGPGEYMFPTSYFLNIDKPNIYVENYGEILEYDFNGDYIRSVQTPEIELIKVSKCSYVNHDLFIGQITNNGKNQYKYCLFSQNGDSVKCFPNYTFFNR